MCVSVELPLVWGMGDDGKLHHKMDSDSDWDSVEIMVRICLGMIDINCMQVEVA